MPTQPMDLSKLQVYPLAWRQSMTRISDVLVNPDNEPEPMAPETIAQVQNCAQAIQKAVDRKASVILMFGAHLVKNGGGSLVKSFMNNRWITHLATNGAAVVHDWEFASQGCSTEDVAKNVASGTFGTWQETGRYIHLALMAGGLEGRGFGSCIGKMIEEDGVELPSRRDIMIQLQVDPLQDFSAAQADLYRAMTEHRLNSGPHSLKHPWKHNSIFGQAYRQDIPITVHPGIGYDIYTNHPLFNGAMIGRAAEVDFKSFCSAVEGLDGGVVISIGSAIMAPQVFEKSLSCVNNLRVQMERNIVHNHNIFVVDIADGGKWDWSLGEPPKDNPAYYMRYCKSFSRMGGKMSYIQSDNIAFLHNLLWELNRMQQSED